jgi:hypothetical protein
MTENYRIVPYNNLNYSGNYVYHQAHHLGTAFVPYSIFVRLMYLSQWRSLIFIKLHLLIVLHNSKVSSL